MPKEAKFYSKEWCHRSVPFRGAMPRCQPPILVRLQQARLDRDRDSDAVRLPSVTAVPSSSTASGDRL